MRGDITPAQNIGILRRTRTLFARLHRRERVCRMTLYCLHLIQPPPSQATLLVRARVLFALFVYVVSAPAPVHALDNAFFSRSGKTCSPYM